MVTYLTESRRGEVVVCGVLVDFVSLICKICRFLFGLTSAASFESGITNDNCVIDFTALLHNEKNVQIVV